MVKTLEGKCEKEARELEREEMLRKIAKVACCDVLSPTPMEQGFEGPYLYSLIVDTWMRRALTLIVSQHAPILCGLAFIRYSKNAIADVGNLLYKVLVADFVQ